MSYLNATSVTWRYAGDARLIPFLGHAFLLQAAHPTIAAGVADHSAFQEDPFGRLQHSWGRVLETVYAPDDRIGREVRAAHRQIKGVTPDGRHYHAYEPEAYFWVLASGHQTIVDASRRFLRPMNALDERRMYAELRELGLRFGLRERDMPATYGEFREWYTWIVDERLQNSPTVQDVLTTVRRPNPPRGVPVTLWNALPRDVAGRLAWLPTIGMLTPALRDRFGVAWGRRDDAQLAVVARASKAAAALPSGPFNLPVARAALARIDAAPAERLAA